MTSSDSAPDTPPDAGRERLRCFVIGPIGSEHAPPGSAARRNYEEALQVLETVIVPACELVGLTAVRADGLTRAGEITEQVFRRLRDDDVVIADLTGANANVMYELGLRHTRSAFTVQIGEYGRLPFDVNVIRTIQFSRSAYGLIQARDQLVEMLETGLAGQFDPVTATRIWFEAEPGAAADEAAALSSAISNHTDVELSEPLGFIDLIAAAEDNYDVLTEAVNEIAARIGELTEAAETATADTLRADERGTGMRGRLVVAARYASDIDRIAQDLEANVDTFESASATVSAGILAMIERLEEDPSQLSEAMEFGTTIRGLAAISRESIEVQREMMDSMQETARAARVIRAPVQRIQAALDGYTTALQAVDEWDRRLQALGVPLPPPSPAVTDDTEAYEEPGEENP
jgi:hypothetical protein